MRKILISAALILVLICSFLVWRSWLLALPEQNFTRPTVQMPSPNAYDFYLEAGIALLPTDKPVDAVQDKPLIPKSQWKTHYPIAKKQDWLIKNTEAMQLVQEGLTYQCRVPPKKFLTDIHQGDFKLLLSVGRMLIVQSRVYSKKGDWNRAAKSALDTLKLGYDVARGGSVLDSLYSAAIAAHVYYEFWDILPHLDKAETIAAAKRLEIILQNRTKYSQILKEEKYLCQVEMLDFFKHTHSWSLRSAVDEKGEFQWNLLPKIFITSRRQMLQEYNAHMDKRIAQSLLPYNADTSPITIPADKFNQLVTSDYQRNYWSHSRAEAKAAFLITDLALHSYRLDNGRYPQSLNTLIPRYINKIAVDPFGKGDTLRYKLTKQKYLLYSVGPDGKDDNGRVVENKKISKEKRSRYTLAPESKGDFVAGMNY
jgi:hypothetical protein